MDWAPWVHPSIFPRVRDWPWLARPSSHRRMMPDSGGAACWGGGTRLSPSRGGRSVWHPEPVISLLLCQASGCSLRLCTHLYFSLCLSVSSLTTFFSTPCWLSPSLQPHLTLAPPLPPIYEPLFLLLWFVSPELPCNHFLLHYFPMPTSDSLSLSDVKWTLFSWRVAFYSSDKRQVWFIRKGWWRSFVVGHSDHLWVVAHSHHRHFLHFGLSVPSKVSPVKALQRWICKICQTRQAFKKSDQFAWNWAVCIHREL